VAAARGGKQAAVAHWAGIRFPRDSDFGRAGGNLVGRLVGARNAPSRLHAMETVRRLGHGSSAPRSDAPGRAPPLGWGGITAPRRARPPPAAAPGGRPGPRRRRRPARRCTLGTPEPFRGRCA